MVLLKYIPYIYKPRVFVDLLVGSVKHFQSSHASREVRARGPVGPPAFAHQVHETCRSAHGQRRPVLGDHHELQRVFWGAHFHGAHARRPRRGCPCIGPATTAQVLGHHLAPSSRIAAAEGRPAHGVRVGVQHRQIVERRAGAMAGRIAVKVVHVSVTVAGAAAYGLQRTSSNCALEGSARLLQSSAEHRSRVSGDRSGVVCIVVAATIVGLYAIRRLN